MVEILAGSLARCLLLKRYLAGESGGCNMSTMFNLCRVMYRSLVSPTLWNVNFNGLVDGDVAKQIMVFAVIIFPKNSL